MTNRTAQRGGLLNAEEVLKIMTRECRDLLDVLTDKGMLTNEDHSATTPEQRNQIIRDHFAMDNSGYGIAVEEWLPGVSAERRAFLVDEVLSQPEYN